VLLWPNRPPPRSPLFPYTTLFRSLEQAMYPTDKTDKRSSQGPPVAVHTEKWITRNLTPKEQAAEAKAYETRGWVAIYSGVLGERSEEHTSELQSRENLVCRLLLEK